MAACEFNVAFAGSADDVLGRAKSAIEKQGGRFEGDATSGSFGVVVFGSTIAGSYTVAAETLQIIIDSKPFLIPCSTIEGFLKSAIGVS